MPERRFNDDEVAAILEQAAKVQPDARTRVAPDGMTLAQLQEIGREVGIAPDTIAHAAAALDLRGTATSRRLLGVPIGVSRTVELPRRLTDEEWELVVADLRETFDARGVMRSEGSMRQWTNGNLHVLLEPTATSQRLRLRTVKGNAFTALTIGAVFLAWAAFGLTVETVQAGSMEMRDLVRAGTVAAVGLGAIGFWAARLPAWARERRAQMEAVATRLMASLRAKP